MGFSCRLGLLASLAVACADVRDDTKLDSACEPASRVHEAAVAEAIGAAPQCKTDTDCVVMEDHAACEDIVKIEGCDLAVHRRVLELYDPVDVSERMCEAAADAELGCTVSALCVPHGPVVCRSGACMFASR